MRRALAVLLFVVLAFACMVMFVSMADISGTPTCHDVHLHLATPNDSQCFQASSFQKTASVTLGFASAALAAIVVCSRSSTRSPVGAGASWSRSPSRPSSSGC